MARLTSDMFVAGLIRTAASHNCSAMLVRRGADQAGAIFIVTQNPDRTCNLYAPAPQMMMHAADDDRKFELRLENVTEREIDAALQAEQRFDSDIFIVELSGSPEIISTLLKPHIIH